MHNYLLEGNDHVIIENKIEEIIKKENLKDYETSIYDLEEQSLDDALEALDTYSFLTTKKVIIIKNISKLNQEENAKKIKHLLMYLENPNEDNVLIVIDSNLDARKKITKDLKKMLECVVVSMNVDDFIKRELKEYKLEPGVVLLLKEYCKEDITMIQNECHKLINYKLDEKEIKKIDVETICIIKNEDSSSLSFDFVKDLGKKDKKNALIKYKKLLNCGVDCISLIGLIGSQFRLIYQVKELSKLYKTDKEITDILQEKSSYRIKKIRELINYYSNEELLKLMQKLENIDVQIKTTGLDPKFLIELFIMNI